MAFQPGNQLHVLGRKAKRITEALDRAMLADDGAKLRKGIDKLMDAFADGEPWAIEQVWNRLEGKAIQHSEVQITKTEVREYSLTELAEIIATPILEHQDSEQPLTQDSGQSLTVDVPRETGVGESTPVAIEGGGVLVGD